MMSLISDVKSELSSLDKSVITLKKFNRLMLGVFVLFWISGYVFSKPVLIIAGTTGTLAILTSFIAQTFGNKVFVIWMSFAFTLGWIMSRVILFFVFYVVVTPIGMLARFFGKKFLDIRFEDHQESYWKKRDNPNVDYTKMS